MLQELNRVTLFHAVPVHGETKTHFSKESGYKITLESNFWVRITHTRSGTYNETTVHNMIAVDRVLPPPVAELKLKQK